MTPDPTLTDRLRDAKETTYRTHILDIAEELFADEGFEGAGVKVVASRAGISLATLYARFPTKLDLYRAVHARRLADLMALAGAPARRGSDALDRMLGSIEGYVTFHMAHPHYLRMHVRDGNAWSVREGLRTEEQVEAWTRGQAWMARTFRDGIKAGLFVDDDPVWMARTTNALHQVALTMWVEGGMALSSEELLGRIRAQFIRTFCVPDKVERLLARRSRHAGSAGEAT